MSKYKILWIDDKWEELDSFKDVCELPKHGFEIVPCKYSEDGMKLFEEQLEEWSGVILDAKVLMNKEEKLDQLKGLTYSLRRIHELSHKRYVPYYIFTGQPDTASGTAFAEEHYDCYYEKDRDEDRLIADIKRNALELEETQIIHKYQDVFDQWSQSKHDLLRILKVLEDENWQNNSVLNDIRKIMDDVFSKFYEVGICSVKPNGTNLNECSRMVGEPFMQFIIPVYIQRSLHSCVAITNPGSHRTETDEHVAIGRSPYLIRSLIYDMLNVLYWCKYLPKAESAPTTKKAVLQAKAMFETKQKEKTNMEMQKTSV